MEFFFLLKGLIIGFAMSVPIGPIGVMCLRKTLAEGNSRGLIIGLGSATADSLYAGIAAFGITHISDLIASQHFWMGLVGGGLLLFLGIRMLRAKRKDPIAPFPAKGMPGSYISAFLIAVTNPVTVFAFIAVFAVFRLGHELTTISAGILVLGVFTGSCIWFLTLSYVATHFRTKLNSSGLRWVNRISGVFVILSGVIALVSSI